MPCEHQHLLNPTPRLASLPCILLCGFLIQAGAAEAHADRQLLTAVAAAAPMTVEELAGSYDANLTIDPARCVLQKVGGESRGTVRAEAGGPGLMIIHLEELSSLFIGPVSVAVDGSSLSYSGPTDIRIGPAPIRANGKLQGRFTPDGKAFVAQFELSSLFCIVRGSIDGARADEIATTSEEPAAPPPPEEAAEEPPAATMPSDDVTAGAESPSGLIGQEVSLQASNYPDRYIRHRFMLGYAEPIRGNPGWDDATFRIVPGLAGQCISLESRNYPNNFLRHQFLRVRLAPREDNDLYRQDATFCMVPGLAGMGGISLESVNAPQHYIRHRYSELWVDAFDGSELNRRDATFYLTNPGGGALTVR